MAAAYAITDIHGSFFEGHDIRTLNRPDAIGGSDACIDELSAFTEIMTQIANHSSHGVLFEFAVFQPPAAPVRYSSTGPCGPKA